MKNTFNFQILIDTADYKQYPVGSLFGAYKITINNIQTNLGATLLLRLKSSVIQYDNGSPTKDLLILINPYVNPLINSITFTSQFNGYIDFKIEDFRNNQAVQNFEYMVLHCTAEEC